MLEVGENISIKSTDGKLHAGIVAEHNEKWIVINTSWEKMYFPIASVVYFYKLKDE